MANLPWKKIFIIILTLALLLSLSACGSKAGKQFQNILDTFAATPDHISRVFSNLMESASGIGEALANSINNIVRGMTGR